MRYHEEHDHTPWSFHSLPTGTSTCLYCSQIVDKRVIFRSYVELPG